MMHLVNILFVFLCLGFTANGQSSTANPNRLARPLRVVVIGSSTAAGVGAKPIDSAWVNRYRTHLKTLHPSCQVVNLAKSGYQTFHLMPTGYQPPPGCNAPDTLRNITRALALRPDAIIVNLPSNDAAAGYDAKTQLDNFEVIAFHAWMADVPLWLTSVQPRNFDSTKIQVQLQVLEVMAKRYGDHVIRFWDALAKPDGTMDPRYDAGDGIHLNNKGHAILYERLVAKNIPTQVTLRNRNIFPADERWTKALPVSDNALRHPAVSPKPAPTVLLQGEQPMDEVTVQVFDANGRSLRKLTVNLPHLLPGDFGPNGVYRIELRKGTWTKTVRWVKT